MLLDSHDLPPSGTLEADVCIVGGGAAGIALALGLQDSSLSVVVVEGGGRTATDANRGTYCAVPGRGARCTLGVEPSKGWFLGGNTNTWAGNCRPLDEPDYEARPWMPNSGWPIGSDELRPYYERAQSVLGLGDLRWYDPEECRPHLEHPPLDVDPSLLTTRMVHICPVLSLAERHGETLETGRDLQVLLRAEAVRLAADPGTDRVAALEIFGAGGRRCRLVAGTFVLCAGGIENARILLDSADVRPEGLGNEHDLVGRHFMEHWWVDIPLGSWHESDVALYQFDPRGPQRVDDTAVWAQLALSPELMRREQLPGISVWFASRRPATASIVAAKMLALSARGRVPPDPITDLRLIGTDAVDAPRHLLRRLPRNRRTLADGYSLLVQVEQVSHPENRVQLSERLDAADRHLPELSVRLTPEERRAHERGLEVVATELGLNTARLVQQMRLMFDGRRCGFFWHHMGTTRIDDDPTRGVVDRNCRVHGVSNLFVLGSAVFPSGGTGPPTLSIVALALRLAEHLVGRPARASQPPEVEMP